MDLKNSSDSEIDYGKVWLITYSDMISLILCFFIIFFNLSAEESSLLKEAKTSLARELEETREENEKLKSQSEDLKNKVFGSQKDYGDFLDYLAKEDLLTRVQLENSSIGLTIRFNEGVLFSSGSAVISSRGLEVLDEIGSKLSKIDNPVVIEGFTDNIPIVRSNYPSNWELSTDRAIGVAKYFIGEKSIEENRVSIAGYGEQRPIDTNETQEGRANNRRIEITILN